MVTRRQRGEFDQVAAAFERNRRAERARAEMERGRELVRAAGQREAAEVQRVRMALHPPASVGGRLEELRRESPRLLAQIEAGHGIAFARPPTSVDARGADRERDHEIGGRSGRAALQPRHRRGGPRAEALASIRAPGFKRGRG